MSTEELRAAAERRRELAKAYEVKAQRLREEAQKMATVAAQIERRGKAPTSGGSPQQVNPMPPHDAES